MNFQTIRSAPATAPRHTQVQIKLERHARRAARAQRRARMQVQSELSANDIHSRSEAALLQSGELLMQLACGTHIDKLLLETTAQHSTRHIDECLRQMRLLGQQLVDRAQHAHEDQQALEPVADLLQMLAEVAVTYGDSAKCFNQSALQCRDVDIKTGSRMNEMSARIETIDAQVLDACKQLQDNLRTSAKMVPPEVLERVPLLMSMFEKQPPRQDLR